MVAQSLADVTLNIVDSMIRLNSADVCSKYLFFEFCRFVSFADLSYFKIVFFVFCHLPISINIITLKVQHFNVLDHILENFLVAMFFIVLN